MSSSRFIQCAVLVVTSLFMTSFAINNDLASRRQGKCQSVDTVSSLLSTRLKYSNF